MAGRATVGEFAAAVRQEYPGQFDGVSDDELVHAVVQEKPELGDQVDLRTFKPTNVVRPKQGPLEEARSLGVSGRALGTAVGAGKSLIRTPYNIIKGVANVAGGQPADAPLNPDLEGALENKNVAESFGGLMTDAALAAGGEGLANAGVKLAVGATKVPRLLGAAGRIVKGAIVGGSVAKAEGGSGTVGAAIGAAGPAAGELADIAGPALKSAAKKSMARVLAATTKPNKVRSEKVVPELIERGITGSQQAIKDTAAAGKEAANAALDEAWAGKAGEKVDIAGITEKMDEAAEKFKYVGPPKEVPVMMDGRVIKGATETVEPEGLVTPNANRFVVTLDRLKTVLTDNAEAGGSIDAEKLRGIKKIWDAVVAEKEGYAGATLTLADRAAVLAHKESANAIRAELGQQFPDIAKINKEYTFWARVHRVMSDTLLRTSSQSQPMGQQLMKAAGYAGGFASGGAAGYSTGHDLRDRIKRGIIGGISGALLRKVTTSGKWGSVSAVTKDRLADVLASGNTAAAGDLVHKIAFSIGVTATRDDGENPNE